MICAGARVVKHIYIEPRQARVFTNLTSPPEDLELVELKQLEHEPEEWSGPNDPSSRRQPGSASHDQLTHSGAEQRAEKHDGDADANESAHLFDRKDRVTRLTLFCDGGRSEVFQTARAKSPLVTFGTRACVSSEARFGHRARQDLT